MAQDYTKISVKDIEKLRGKTLFLTGSNGLVGGNILSYLYYLNKTINLNLKIIAHSFSKPVFWLPKDENITYLSSDLNAFDEKFYFDYLIHAATYGQPRKVLENQIQTITLNTLTYIKLLEEALENKAKVLFISTSEIYGERRGGGIGIDESFNGTISTLSARSLYAESKRMAEVISKMFIDKGLEIKIARLAIGYGPGVKLDDKRFLCEFIKKALNEKEIKMLDQGEAKRQMGYIVDVVEMLLNVLLSSKEVVYNISGLFFEDKASKIIDIARIIAKELGVEVVLPKEDKSLAGTPAVVVLDIQKYINEFQKESFFPIEYGVKRSIEWIKLLQNQGG